jgi:hypothetical protein
MRRFGIIKFQGKFEARGPSEAIQYIRTKRPFSEQELVQLFAADANLGGDASDCYSRAVNCSSHDTAHRRFSGRLLQPRELG